MSESLKVSGKKYEIPAALQGWKLTVRPGGWVLAESPSGERQRLMLHEARGKLGASLGGVLYQGEIQSKQRQAAGGASGGDADLVAQFPGKVRKVVVSDGAQVQEGDSLVLVEAMKMEFAVKAPFAGTIKRVLVKEGQQLSPGDRFVDLVESKSG